MFMTYRGPRYRVRACPGVYFRFGFRVLGAVALYRRRMTCATVVPSRRLFLSSDTPGPEADRQNGLVNVSHSGVAVVLVISRAFVGAMLGG